jgi:AraC-like DNA-binding protein
MSWTPFFRAANVGKKIAITQELRAQIEGAALVGARDKDLADAFGISERTLRSRFRTELTRARARGIIRLKQTAHHRALNGSDTLLIFLLKARGGMSERQAIEVVGAGGQPLLAAPPQFPELRIIEEVFETSKSPAPADMDDELLEQQWFALEKERARRIA